MYSKITGKLILLGLQVVLMTACRKDPELRKFVLSTGPTPYLWELPPGFPPMKIPGYNPMTEEGVALGRKLFYDPILSGNNTQSCSDCHQQKASFADSGKRFSRGSTGVSGARSSMPIFNIGYAGAWFWDGRASTLEEQVFHPVTSPNEMDQDMLGLVKELSNSADYRSMYEAAFGSPEITFDKTAMALAQFMRTIIARVPAIHDTTLLSPSARRGLKVFLSESKGDCFHCHELGNFMTNFSFVNNGLNEKALSDPGLYAVSRKTEDLGKFKVPSLINLRYTAPYMHDGRFANLNEVLDFYDTGFHWNPIDNPFVDPNLQKHFDKVKGKPLPRKWTAQDKSDLIDYLNSLTDQQVLNNQKYAK